MAAADVVTLLYAITYGVIACALPGEAPAAQGLLLHAMLVHCQWGAGQWKAHAACSCMAAGPTHAQCIGTKRRGCKALQPAALASSHEHGNTTMHTC
jgi:hypothetical protein